MQDADKLRRFLLRRRCASGDLVTLAEKQSRHLAVVLRIETGERVRVFTGEGEEFIARVEKADPEATRLRVLRRSEDSPLRQVALILGFAPPAKARADMLVEKAAELGATVLQPLLCERLQGFQRRQAGKRRDRWVRKAEAAARQSGRTLVPRVREPEPFARFVEDCSAEFRLIAATGAPTGLWRTLSGVKEVPAAVALAVGPAGGFTGREREQARRAGFGAVSLGPGVLRVETAAICLLGGVCLWLEARGEIAGEGPPA